MLKLFSGPFGMRGRFGFDFDRKFGSNFRDTANLSLTMPTQRYEKGENEIGYKDLNHKNNA